MKLHVNLTSDQRVGALGKAHMYWRETIEGNPQHEKLFAQVPFYRPVTVEKNAFRGVIEDIIQVGVINVIVTHESVAESVVFSMAKTISDNLDTLPQKNPLFKGLKNLFEPLRTQGAAAFEFGGVSLHPGARKAYKEAGWLK